MKTQSAKTYINQLLNKYKSIEAVASILDISPRFVYYLKNGERKANVYMIRYMKELLKK